MPRLCGREPLLRNAEIARERLCSRQGQWDRRGGVVCGLSFFVPAGVEAEVVVVVVLEEDAGEAGEDLEK